MNMYQWLESVKADRKKKPMPVLSYPGIQLMGITVKDLISDAEYQARGMKLVADATDALASVSLMDLSVEAECFGTTPEEADALTVPSVRSARAGIYLDAIAKAKQLITDRPVFAGVIGPFSLAGRLVDVTEAMILCYEDPDMLKVVLDKCTEFLIAYISEYQKTGADGVVIAEPLAGMLSPDLAAEFSAPYVEKIVRACQNEEFLIVYHNCGNGAVRMIDSILSTGAVPSDVVVMGNIDPAGQFLSGTEQSVYEDTLALLKDCGEYQNFILSSGCDIPPLAPWDNIRAFFRAAKDYYKY